MGGACLGSYMAQMYSTSHAIILLTLFLFFAFFIHFFIIRLLYVLTQVQ